MIYRPSHRPFPPHGRPAFSFVEVLFAVMILGIGFIMIAGIFPVAISQTALTQEETVAASTARGAVAAYESIPNLAARVAASGAAGDVVRLTGNNWDLVRGNQILAEDPRYGWAALLLRDATTATGQPPSTARLFVIPCQVRGRAAFTATDVLQGDTNDNAHATLMPLPIKVRLLEGYDVGPDLIRITDGIGAGAAAPGAVVVLSRQSQRDQSNRSLAGRAYRLGNVSDEASRTYEQLPGNDLSIQTGPNGQYNANGAKGAAGGGDDLRESTTDDLSTGTEADAFIVGRAVANPGVTGAPTFDGPSVATGLYISYVALK